MPGLVKQKTVKQRVHDMSCFVFETVLHFLNALSTSQQRVLSEDDQMLYTCSCFFNRGGRDASKRLIA